MSVLVEQQAVFERFQQQGPLPAEQKWPMLTL